MGKFIRDDIRNFEDAVKAVANDKGILPIIICYFIAMILSPILTLNGLAVLGAPLFAIGAVGILYTGIKHFKKHK